MDNYDDDLPRGRMSEDVLALNDADMADDLPLGGGGEREEDEAHHRRHRYDDDDRERSRDRGRERERERSRERSPGRVGGGGVRDDKYDRRGSGGGGRVGGRSRSRSPVRGGGGGVGGGGHGHGNSMKDRRVYVGNMSYEVRWTGLKDFMREIGPVAHADVMLGPDGRSKGCGVVEFQTVEDAKTAIRKLNGTNFMGRPILVREDRESDARIGFSGGRGVQANNNHGGHGGHGGGSMGAARRESAPSAGMANNRQVYVGNLPFNVTWRDLKVLFRKAGPMERADVIMDKDQRSRGFGTVLFESHHDVHRAIAIFDTFEWHGRRLEVREDKFGTPAPRVNGAVPSTSASSRYDGPSSSSGMSSRRDSDYRREDYGRSHSHSGTSGNGGHQANNGSYSYGNGGGGGGGGGAGRHQHDEYRRDDRRPSGHGSASGAAPAAYDGPSGQAHGGRGFVEDDLPIPSGPAAGSGDQIYIRNLPLTTTTQDLKDLFRTCGLIRMTEILEHAGRPKGAGIVRFEQFESADKAVSKFNGYVYGGRPLEITYDRV